MINFNAPDLLIQEKINRKISRTLYTMVKHKSAGFAEHGFNFNTLIKRFAAEDIYSIYGTYNANIKMDSWIHDLYGHQYVNIINNKIKLQKYFVLGERDYKLATGEILLHHSEIGQKFRETSYLYSFLNLRSELAKRTSDRFYKNKALFSKLASLAFFLSFPSIEKTYRVASNHLVRMSFIKKLNAQTIQQPLVKDHNTNNDNPALDINSLSRTTEVFGEIYHSDFFIAFNKLDWIAHNYKLATIYWKPNHKTDVFDSDFKFQKDSYIKIGTKKYPIIFKKRKNIAKIKRRIARDEVIAVGDIVMPSFTSYDFDKKKATSDFNEFSQRGVFIPYDFKGRFFYRMHIGINGIFKDMDFYVYQNVDQKALDPYVGKIRVEIASDDIVSEPENSNAVTISSKHFKQIIDLGEIINPLAIARYGNEEEQEES